MNWKIIFITFTFAAIYQFSIVHAQICGTVVTANQKTLENSFTVPQANPNQSLPQINWNLSIAFYIVKDSLGNSGITATDIDAAVSKLSGYFSPIALKFHTCKIIYIDNYLFDVLYADKNEKDLTNSFFLPGVINIYVANSLYDKLNSIVTGFTYMPFENKNFVFISKSTFNGSEIGHQFGHLFNLYHTHESTFNFEYVDGTNCTTAGDRCCDTEADPNLKNLVDNNCLYSGKLKDPNISNSQFYKPSAKNLMSLSQDGCRCFLSPTQFARIYYALQNLKSSLK